MYLPVRLQIPFMKDRTDIVALLDEFAGRFYDELDYNQECLNGCVCGGIGMSARSVGFDSPLIN